MGIESSTTIQGLDASWPLSGDRRSEGDDHLRLIKSVLKAAFPGEDGLGFNVPITAKEADLNAAFTAGVKTVFYMATAPIGWTVVNFGANYTLVSAAAGGSGGGGAGRGDNLVTGCNVVPDHQHAQQGTFTSGASNQSLAHVHEVPGKTLSASATFFNGQSGGAIFDAVRGALLDASASGTEPPAHTHNVTISGQTSNVNTGVGATGAIGTWQPLYALVIIASRN